MNRSTALEIVRPLALGIGMFGAAGAIGSAQATAPCGPVAYNSFDPADASINAWQTAWDTGNYDRNHMLLGTVGSFAPYRLTLLNPAGDSMTIDLKNGTVIRPTGLTPAAGQKVAVFGYWSNGTFIANRVVLHG
ncbi:MAG TPA: hypothetical protein VGN14_06100 [Candidatus Elarobacter sp.]|jgi:hypothetical protein